VKKRLLPFLSIGLSFSAAAQTPSSAAPAAAALPAPAADAASLEAGKAALAKQDFDGALREFNKVKAQSPASRLRGEAIYLSARALVGAGRARDALTELAKIQVREIPSDTRDAVFLFWAQTASQEARWLEASLALLKARSEMKEPARQKEIEAQIEEHISVRLGEPELNFLLREYPGEFPSGPVQYRLASLRLAKGQKLEAQQLLAGILKSTPAGQPLHTKASQLMTRLNSLDAALTLRIGACLPMSGRGEAAGRAVRSGLELALAESSKHALELVVADCGATVETASAAFDRMIFEEKVMAVIGPFSGDQAEAIAEKAVQLGVPNITLSPRPGLLQKGASVFRVALTPERQVAALVGYAKERLGAKNFAILFPEDAFGREFAQEYFRLVREFGGEVTAAESYAPNQSDFRIPIENMTGTGFPSWRVKEQEELRKQLQEKIGERKPTKAELESSKIKPIVDFDVLLIPDAYRALGQIVPALLYADVSTPQLMGPSTWNSPRLLERAGQYLDKAVFVDMFAMERQSPATKNFVNLYQSKKGSLPNSLNALGYDIGAALKLAYGNDRAPESRDELRSRLEVLGTFDGALGQYTWNADREALSEIQLFQVRRGAFHHQTGILIAPR
jgi:ABC-type branched-subunit amino acid transport system substrate-binding protein